MSDDTEGKKERERRRRNRQTGEEVSSYIDQVTFWTDFAIGHCGQRICRGFQRSGIYIIADNGG